MFNESESELKQDIKLSLAIRLFNLQKITLGKAAEVAGISKYEFETQLSDYGFPISHLTLEDVELDLKKLK